MDLLFLLPLVVYASAASTVPPSASTECPQAPAQAPPADEHYRISVAGEPDLFLPGELYTVSLQGIDSGQGPTPFIGFSIWVEIKSEQSKTDKVETQSTEATKLPLGTFQAYDAQAKIHEMCSPAVDNATAHPKTEVQVIWNAPSSIKDACIRLCARVGPTPAVGGGGGGGWSMLVRELCSAPAAPPNFAKLPPIVEPCCACDEAKYEVTFECLWSRNTHPREFPPESARAHFGDVIGASHTAQFRVWQEGRVASPGMRRLADDGTTVALEKELKAESDHIRTIIKARGISWQQVGGAGIPNTFAVFRVDAKHHLISLAAKLAPSPDWIVGVSALELCNANCTWSRSATIPLYPYDAGTDSGISYTSHRTPTMPATPVRALRPDWPRDARSPFYSTTGDMRPFARLRLTRLRLYEKSCDPTEGEPDRIPESNAGGSLPSGSSSGLGVGGACATHAWGAWGPCSVSCGPGRATRQRHYVWPTRAYAEACRVALTDYRRCHGPRMHCRAPSEYEPDPAESSGPCAVSNWSEWSPCEGCGVRARTRHYVVPRAYKRCHIGYRARTIMSQAMPCDKGPCEKPPSKMNVTSFDWFYMNPPPSECSVTEWGTWSPCSARCGRGRRLRGRFYVLHPHQGGAKAQQEIGRRLLITWSRRFAELQSLEHSTDNFTAVNPVVEKQVHDYLERCQFTLTQQEALCDGDDVSCLNNTTPLEVCKLPMSVGHCRGYEERWFYEWAKHSCEPFGFSGCGGNGNNFRTRDHCLRACRTLINHTEENATTVTTEVTAPAPAATAAIKKLKPTPPHADNEVIQNDDPRRYGYWKWLSTVHEKPALSADELPNDINQLFG
ncbi:spondin-1-like isoform X2 [Trichoplusia ni]|uniref:Spondin-1 n=1 Tax=Trichoplusia ni TaxID=7111 RepID=A0A7E5X3B0_TRINI|nr:spondin-1-like isoform X2 [Trichoplusia ni]